MKPQRQETLTRLLAREISATPVDAIPKFAMEGLTRLIVDHVGITYMGAALSGPALFGYARDLGGRADAVLIGDGASVPAEMAAGVNGQHCRMTNFEESGPGRHLGPLCVHTALAVGQRVNATGTEVLAAAVLGYVLCGRFHFAQRVENGLPHHRVVAAAIAARLLGFETDKTSQAISLAWELPHRARHFSRGRNSTPLFRRKRISPLGTPGELATPLFHARAGIQAALMVSHGFSSVADEIDEYVNDYDVEAMTRGPIPFHVINQMELKPWPCVRPAQCAIQALSQLAKQHRIDAHSITGITLRVPSVATVPHQYEPDPETWQEAVYSLQWAAAMVLQGVPPGPKWVTQVQLRDSLSRRLAAAVEVIEDLEATAAYSQFRRPDVKGTAEVRTSNQTYVGDCTLGETEGGAGRPMSEQRVERKFLESTSISMTDSRARHLLTALLRFDEVGDIRELAARF